MTALSGAGDFLSRPTVSPLVGAPPAVALPGALTVDDLTIATDVYALETRRLCKSFGASIVLRGMELRIPEGSLATVLGPPGAGKSVLLKHMTGVMEPDSGEVLVRGRPLSRMSRSEVLALRRDIGVMFQDGALFSSMTVYENVAFPLKQHTDLDDAEIDEVVMDQLMAVGLDEAAQRMPHDLSSGMRKRAGLARALVLDPGIVLCDEPDWGLDPVRTALLGELLRERHGVLGGTMVIVTHDIALARLVSDHVSVLWDGKIVAAGPSEDIFGSNDPFIRQFLAGKVAGQLDAGS